MIKKKYKTTLQLTAELEQMRKKVREVEECQAEFQKAQSKYDKLLDSSPDAMIFVNSDNRIVMTNAQFEKLFGYGHDEVAGNRLDILIPERFREKHGEKISEYFKHPRVRSMGSSLEIYAKRKDGSEFPVDISLSPLQTDEELLVSAAVRDITERRRAEEQVEMNYIIQRVLNDMLKISLEPLALEVQFERILKLILSVPYLSLQSKGAIYIREDDPEVLVLKAHHGFSESDPVPCKTVSFGKCLCGKAALGSKVVYANHANENHDIHYEGQFPHGHYCVPIVSGQNLLGLINVFVKEGHKRRGGEEAFLTSVASTLAGIIQHNRTEREKEHLQSQLAQSEKLAALGRFTANVAHEIRNPLTALGGFARRLDRTIPEDTKEKEYASFMISEVSRLEGILKNILTFSRDVKPQMDECNINDIIDRVLKMTEDICREKSIKVHTSYGNVHTALIDDTQLHEALENIILNAIDAMSGGGDLTVATGEEMHEGIPCVFIKIQDSGAGISPEDQKLIFEPFYTTKVSEKGTGLGLSITKKVVESHGGFMKVESTVGKGSVFILYFPANLRAEERGKTEKIS